MSGTQFGEHREDRVAFQELQREARNPQRQLEARLREMEATIANLQDDIRALQTPSTQTEAHFDSPEFILQRMRGGGFVRLIRNRGEWIFLGEIVAPFTAHMTGATQVTIRGGTVYIEGLGSWAMADTPVTLTADPAYIYVRMAWTGETPVALESSVTPTSDSQYLKWYLCKCASDGAGRYSIPRGERRYLGGDIHLAAPLA